MRLKDIISSHDKLNPLSKVIWNIFKHKKVFEQILKPLVNYFMDDLSSVSNKFVVGFELLTPKTFFTSATVHFSCHQLLSNGKFPLRWTKLCRNFKKKTSNKLASRKLAFVMTKRTSAVRRKTRRKLLPQCKAWNRIQIGDFYSTNWNGMTVVFEFVLVRSLTFH